MHGELWVELSDYFDYVINLSIAMVIAAIATAMLVRCAKVLMGFHEYT